MVAQGLPAPDYSEAVARATAADVESWVRAAFLLKKAYTTGSSDVARMKLPGTMITWVKLIRGRWCIIADSSYNESRLSLWDAHSDSGIELIHQVFLPGPVMDGVADESEKEYRIAITVGAK